MPNTNITGLPRTGLVDTNVIRSTKSAALSTALNPVLLPFRKSDLSFNRDLTMSFDRGAMVNVQVAPVLTAQETTDLSAYSPSFQDGNFTQVAVKLDYVNTVGWKRRQVQEAVSDVDEAEIRGIQAGTAITKKMYRRVVTSLVNDALIAADQVIGTTGTAFNVEAINRMRTLASVFYNIPRETLMRIIVNPYIYEDLANSDKFINNDYKGENGQTITRGLLSTVYNVEIFEDAELSLTEGGNSMSVSGSEGVVAMGMVDESFVLPIRRMGVMDPSKQYEAVIDGVPILGTIDNDISSGPGLTQNQKLDILWGIKALPAIRSNGNTGTKIFLFKGGLA